MIIELRGCCAKIYEENYHDSIHADECTVELRQTTIKTWFKSNNNPLGAAAGKVVKLTFNNIHQRSITFNKFNNVQRRSFTFK